jgi:hypothetical protein
MVNEWKISLWGDPLLPILPAAIAEIYAILRLAEWSALLDDLARLVDLREFDQPDPAA